MKFHSTQTDCFSIADIGDVGWSLGAAGIISAVYGGDNRSPPYGFYFGAARNITMGRRGRPPPARNRPGKTRGDHIFIQFPFSAV